MSGGMRREIFRENAGRGAMFHPVSATASTSLSASLELKLRALRADLARLNQVVVAFSGGVDSSLMLKLAVDVLGEGAVAVLAVSPSLPQAEKEDAIRLAQEMGARLELIDTREVEDPEYAVNAPNRCFFCKDHVYGALTEYAKIHGYTHVLDGMNADDTLDIRPGRAAAMKHGVRSPLHEAGLNKAEVREAARALGLSSWDKPAAACLSSRVPYGTRVTATLLQRIESAEAYLKSLGFAELRVRHHDDVARVEVPLESLVEAVEKHAEITGGLKALGWTYVTLDLDGLRTGSMNEVLKGVRAKAGVAAE